MGVEIRKIVFLSLTPDRGEAGQVLYELSTALERERWTPVVVLPAHGELEAALAAAGVRTEIAALRPIPTGPQAGRAVYQAFGGELRTRVERLAELIRSEQPAVVVTLTTRILEGALAAKLAGAAHVWVIEAPGEPPALFDAPLFFAALDALCVSAAAVSDAAQAQALRWLPAHKVAPIAPGADGSPLDMAGFTRLLEQAAAQPSDAGGARIAEDLLKLAVIAAEAKARLAGLALLEDPRQALAGLLEYPAYTPHPIAPLQPPGSGPKVSVCVPVFNGAQYLRTCIESILAQTFADFELVIVDDASSDTSVQIARSFHDPRLRVLQNERNLGLVGNWNRCLETAAGEYVTLFHQDDRMAPDNLMQKVAVLDANPQVGLVYSDMQIIDPEGQVRSEHGFELLDPNMDFIRPGRLFFDLMFESLNLVSCPSVIARRACYENLAGFDARLPFSVDMEMWMRIALFYDVAYLARPLIQYRVHPGNQTQRYSALNLIHIYLCKRLLLEKYPQHLGAAYQTALLVNTTQKIFEWCVHLYQQQQYKTAMLHLEFLKKIRAEAERRELIDEYIEQLLQYVHQGNAAAWVFNRPAHNAG